MAFRIPKKDQLPDNLRRSRQHEKATALRIGGRQTPRSGAGTVKGDVQLAKFVRGECKTTKHKSFSVTRADIEKLEDASLGHGELPFYIVRLEGPPMLEVVVMPAYVMDLIKAKLESADAT